MLKQNIAHIDGTPLDVHSGIDDHPTLITEGLRCLECHWQTGVNDASETTTIVSARYNQAILITDIVITSSKKVNSSTVTLQFADGTNTETLMVIDGAEAPVEFSLNLQGGIRGWKNADLQVVTNQAGMYAVTFVGYVHISPESTKDHDIWDAER